MNSQIKIIYEDKNLLAVNKPAGLLVHPIKLKAKSIKPEAEFTLVDWLVGNYPEIKKVGDDSENRPGIVHRLDKDTSGVILIPKNQKYFEYLKNLFQTHQIKKIYLALVYGRLDKEGIIDKPISIKSGTIKRTVSQKKAKDTKEAITEYKVKKYLSSNGQDFSLVEVMPKTGRTHQIRVHLASIHYPIVGDPLYGPKNLPASILSLNHQFLHAESIEFNLEEGKRVKIEAELPEELEKFLKKIENK